MLNIKDAQVVEGLLKNRIGLEKESLRVLENGHFAHTSHPVNESKYIVRDFCENQTEINTPIFEKTEDALQFMVQMEQQMYEDLAHRPEPELLWPFSNPPYIKNEQDIPVAQYTGSESGKMKYREYLASMYGRYKMTFCGIHLNFSFADELLHAAFNASDYDSYQEFKDQVYLHLAQETVRYGWLINVLTSASPVLDSSFIEKGSYGRSVYTGLASVRSSESGYWNFFTPILDYSSAKGYAGSIQDYVNDGLIVQASELYYPIRLKPHGENKLANFDQGISHIELRMLDLNPLSIYGIAARDVDFIRYFLTWLACKESGPLTKSDQVLAAGNFKKAAHMDLKTVKIHDDHATSKSIIQKSYEVLDEMQAFYDNLGIDLGSILELQYEKLRDKNKRYAYRLQKILKDDFVKTGLIFARQKRDILMDMQQRQDVYNKTKCLQVNCCLLRNSCGCAAQV